MILSSERKAIHARSNKSFAIQAIIYEIILLIFFGIFVKVNPDVTEGFNEATYPLYQDANVMMLIGLGFLMSFIKDYTWSPLTYTFLINCFAFQFYILWEGFWMKVFRGEWEEPIYIDEVTLKRMSGCVAACLISFEALLGKVEANSIMILINVGVFFYSLNAVLCYEVLGLYDSGGSITVHTFGAYYGLTMALLISWKINPTKEIKMSKTSGVLGLLGALFLWVFWPATGDIPFNQFQKSLVISNKVLALTGSCVTALAVSALIRENHKFNLGEDVLCGTLAGGVIIGASAGLITNPAAALAIGCIGGAVCTICYAKLKSKVSEKFSLHDTCGVNNLHGIPGFLGGILSAIVVASYQSQPMDENIRKYLSFYEGNDGAKSLAEQAGIQVAGTFISLGIAVVAGLISGFFMRMTVSLNNEELFEDSIYFTGFNDEDDKLNDTL